ncbi:MAG: PEP-CTERM sorting domain-containing protein [Nitrospira sp.]|nr:PEP-CTERM sorting domain-containing protein [bacterium]MBL7048660.1 PEP-CTERM sorting domain-containing protein [Nitrospira sp.]
MSIVTTGGSSKLYAAIVTGLSQAGSKDPWRYNNSSYGYDDWNQSKEKYWYDSGDVGFDIGGDGTYEYAVTTRNTDVHSTYNPTPGAGLLVSGNLQWEDPLTWNYNDVTEDWNHVSDPWAVKSYDDSVDLGSNFSYSEFQGRYAIEMIIDLSLMDLNEWDALHMVWTMECGNDQITLDMVIPAINGGSSVNPVPEPGTIILLGAGLAGLGVLRRSRRS